MKKKGFTLIELLAVIVILAIIALIATPIVLDIISDTKRNSTLRSAEFYMDAVEQSIAKQIIDDPNFKATECKINEDGNLLCSELGFNVCEERNTEVVCSGNEKEIKVEVSGEKPTEGIIELSFGKVEDVELVLGNNSLVINENTLVFENDTKVIYEENYINSIDGTQFFYYDIDELNYDTLYKIATIEEGKTITKKAMIHTISEGMIKMFQTGSDGGIMIIDYNATGLDIDDAVKLEKYTKIEKTNEKVIDYGVRITPNRFLFISREFKPGEVNIKLIAENLEKEYNNAPLEQMSGKYSEIDFGISSDYYNYLKEGKNVYIQIEQEIDGKKIIRKYGGPNPKYQKDHDYSQARDSYYWGTDFFPFSGE